MLKWNHGCNTNDGNTSYGRSSGSGNDYYLELDDSTEDGTINSVVVKAFVRSDGDPVLYQYSAQPANSQ